MAGSAEWRIGHFAPDVSPLYRMASAEPDETMQAVQKFIGTDASKAEKLSEELHGENAELSTEGLITLLDKLGHE